MKSNIIKSGILLSVISLFVFGSCTKENVKHGNKRIIGTWTLSSQKSKSTESGTDNYTFTANVCGYDSYSSSYTDEDSTIIEGTTVHEYYNYVETEDGETTTDKGDTTYTENDSFQLTFNEDGTCIMKETSIDTDSEGNPDNYEYEYSGYWSWMDSYEEKSGIVLDFSGINNKKSTSGAMRLYIKSLDKEELVFEYTTTYTNTYEYTMYWASCWNDDTQEYTDVYRTKKGNSTGSEYGEMILDKVEE